jgi:hypothetical protein
VKEKKIKKQGDKRVIFKGKDEWAV